MDPIPPEAGVGRHQDALMDQSVPESLATRLGASPSYLKFQTTHYRITQLSIYRNDQANQILSLDASTLSVVDEWPT